MSTPRAVDGWRWAWLPPMVAVQLWAAHALAFFAHEYAHAAVAWALGWKRSPLDLHVPPLTPVVALIQLGITQGVDEAPIYAAGRGIDAGLIALAGMMVGNGLVTYPLGRLGYAWARRARRPEWAMFAFWVVAASVGNFIAYAPVRVFAAEGDMAAVERGFGWSPWLVLALLGAPTLLAAVEFFGRFTPAAMRTI